MATSQNGWPASEHLDIVPLTIDGVSFLPGIRGGDVHTVLEYVAQQVHDRVEKAVDPGCWGFFFRANRNDPNSLSNHSSGTAIDFNAPQHPNGVPTNHTWTGLQVATIHQILAEVDGVVRWGGDYHHVPDAMHFEINAGADAVARVAADIKALEDPMATSEVQNQLDRIERIVTNLRDKSRDRFQRLLAELDDAADQSDIDTIKARIKDIRQKVQALQADDTTEEKS